MTQISFLDLLRVAFSDLRAGHLPPNSILTLLISKVIAVCRAKQKVSDLRGAEQPMKVYVQFDQVFSSHYMELWQPSAQILHPSVPLQALGYGILAFSCVLKVPQIVAVAQAKSAEGLAPISFELEQIGLSVHTAYGFLLDLPFNTYGEAAIILLQNTYLLAQIYYYSKAPVWRSAFLTLALGVAGSAVLTGAFAHSCISFQSTKCVS